MGVLGMVDHDDDLDDDQDKIGKNWKLFLKRTELGHSDGTNDHLIMKKGKVTLLFLVQMAKLSFFVAKLSFFVAK